jgi:selenocysteine lyase/cysteine desulfurase
MPFDQFRDRITQDIREGRLHHGLIGEGRMIPGLEGDVRMVYADYVASGRALRQIEEFVAEDVLPFYANSHTEASFTGGMMTRMRRAAREEIAQATGCGAHHAVIFAGSGATAGLNRLVRLFGVDSAAVVFIGPYEHHSNILPWRESGATVVEIPEADTGGPDLDALAAGLVEHGDKAVKVGSFSAASNVTGIITETDPVSRLLRAHGARVIWDFAGGGPYLPIDMCAGTDAEKDAVVVSPHKFPGGPGASGVLIVNRDAVVMDRPSWPGGGTVSFVSPWSQDYSADLTAREEAGTPNVIGDIRAALAFVVKEAVGHAAIHAAEERWNAMALAAWGGHPQLTLLGSNNDNRLPIFSMLVRQADGTPVHQQLFTRMLSDIYGIQTRGGCACAGPYAHRLLDIDEAASEALRSNLKAGKELDKPGWVRLNFSYLMTESTVQYILTSVLDLLGRLDSVMPLYACDPTTARFRPAA